MVSEADDNIQICVLLTAEVPVQRNTSVAILVLPGTATAPDFTTDEEIQLSFSETGTQCFSVTITADLLLEDAEEFSVVLIPSESTVTVTTDSASIIITDSESRLRKRRAVASTPLSEFSPKPLIEERTNFPT